MDKNRESSWTRNWEFTILGLTAIITILITLLDFVGALDSLPWIKDRVPILTLLSVGLVASYLLLERRSKLEAMHEELHVNLEALNANISRSTEQVIASVGGVTLTLFQDGMECFDYMNQRVAEAKKRIDDLSWNKNDQISPDFHRQGQLDKTYGETLERVTQRIPFREILVFQNRPGRLNKLRKRLLDAWPGYSCGYYENTDIPLLKFMIIDGIEVIIAPNDYSTSLAITHPKLVGLFVEYFDEIWRQSRKLKHGRTIYWAEVETVLGTHDAREIRDQLENR